MGLVLARVRARTIRSRRLRQPPHRPGPLIRRPHLVEQTGSSSLRQGPGVEAIRLGPRLGDRLELARVGDHDPDAHARCSIATIRSVPVVASSATTSPGSRLCANSSSAPARASRSAPPSAPPSSAIATSQKSRCTSNPSPRTPSSRRIGGSAAGHTTKTDSCSQHTGASRRGGHEQRRAHSSSVRRPARPRLPRWPLVPRARSSRRGRTAVSSPDNAIRYRAATTTALACRELGLKHLFIPPLPAPHNGKVCVLASGCRPLGGEAPRARRSDSGERRVGVSMAGPIRAGRRACPLTCVRFVDRRAAGGPAKLT